MTFYATRTVLCVVLVEAIFYGFRYLSVPPPALLSIDGGVGTKVVWQTYRRREDIPFSIRIARRRMMDANPSWTFVVMDDRDVDTFLSAAYPRAASLVRSVRPHYGAVKADVWRYAILHAFGGVYLDMDSYINTPLDTWVDPARHSFSYAPHPLTDRMPLWTSMNVTPMVPPSVAIKPQLVVQWAMVAPRGSPVMKTALDLAVDRLCREPSLSMFPSERRIFYATGPDVLLHAVWRHYKLVWDRIVGVDFDGRMTFKMQGLSSNYRHHNDTILRSNKACL